MNIGGALKFLVTAMAFVAAGMCLLGIYSWLESRAERRRRRRSTSAGKAADAAGLSSRASRKPSNDMEIR